LANDLTASVGNRCRFVYFFPCS